MRDNIKRLWIIVITAIAILLSVSFMKGQKEMENQKNGQDEIQYETVGEEDEKL